MYELHKEECYANSQSSLNCLSRQNSELAEMGKQDKTQRQIKWFKRLNMNQSMTVKLYKLHNLYHQWITSYGQTIINSLTGKCITSVINLTAKFEPLYSNN